MVCKRSSYGKWVMLLLVLIVVSCVDKIDRSDIYTFTGQMAMDYIDSNPDLSIYAKILRKSRNSHKNNSSSVSALLGTRGQYNVFAPNNKAMHIYLDSIYGTHDIDVDTISQDVADRIVLYSVIDYRDDKARQVMQLDDGAQVNGTLNDSHVIVRFGDWGNGVIARINNKSRVVKGNIAVENGYVHIVDRVIPPGPTSVAGIINAADNMKIFSTLLEVTSWGDSIVKYEDVFYRDSLYYIITKNKDDWYTEDFARNLFYGYTAFVETDDVFQREWGVPAFERDPQTKGVTNMDEIVEYINGKCKEAYPDAKDEDPHSMDNAMNQFVSYHLIPYKTRYYLLGYNGTSFGASGDSINLFPTDGFDYYPTMGKPSRLLKITKSVKNDNALYLNRHCYYNDSYYGDYQETLCDVEGIRFHEYNDPYGETYAPNGYCFPIDGILLYNNIVKYTVLNERIRYSIPLTIPELANFSAKRPPRQQGSYGVGYVSMDFLNSCKGSRIIPPGFCSTLSTTDNFVYPNYDHGFHMSTLSLAVNGSSRQKEVILKLLPVPYSGEWEIRIASICGVLFHSYLGETMVEKDMKDLGIHDYTANKVYSLPVEVNNPQEAYNFYLRCLPGIYLVDSTTLIENNRLARQHGQMYMPYGIGYCVYKPNLGVGCPYYHVWQSRRFYEGFSSHDRNQFSKFNHRSVFYRGHLDAQKEYYLKIKVLLETSNMLEHNIEKWNLEFVELVPQCVYDNPLREEDFW